MTADRIGLPVGVGGSLWLCGVEAAVERYCDGWETIVCLVERHELEGRHDDYLAWLDAADGRAVWEPIADFGVPPLAVIASLSREVAVRLRSGQRVLVHCAAGLGRSGTTAVAVLVALGVPVSEALARVTEDRPGAGPETEAQRNLIDLLADAG